MASTVGSSRGGRGVRFKESEEENVGIVGAGSVGSGTVTTTTTTTTSTNTSRGRRGSAAAVEEDDSEDNCFYCGKSGTLVICDVPGCGKVYHAYCMGYEPSETERFQCATHFCAICGDADRKVQTTSDTHLLRCTTCPSAYCPRCKAEQEAYMATLAAAFPAAMAEKIGAGIDVGKLLPIHGSGAFSLVVAGVGGGAAAATNSKSVSNKNTPADVTKRAPNDTETATATVDANENASEKLDDEAVGKTDFQQGDEGGSGDAKKNDPPPLPLFASFENANSVPAIPGRGKRARVGANATEPAAAVVLAASSSIEENGLDTANTSTTTTSRHRRAGTRQVAAAAISGGAGGVTESGGEDGGEASSWDSPSIVSTEGVGAMSSGIPGGGRKRRRRGGGLGESSDALLHHQDEVEKGKGEERRANIVLDAVTAETGMTASGVVEAVIGSSLPAESAMSAATSAGIGSNKAASGPRPTRRGGASVPVEESSALPPSALTSSSTTATTTTATATATTTTSSTPASTSASSSSSSSAPSTRGGNKAISSTRWQCFNCCSDDKRIQFARQLELLWATVVNKVEATGGKDSSNPNLAANNGESDASILARALLSPVTDPHLQRVFAAHGHPRKSLGLSVGMVGGGGGGGGRGGGEFAEGAAMTATTMTDTDTISVAVADAEGTANSQVSVASASSMTPGSASASSSSSAYTTSPSTTTNTTNISPSSGAKLSAMGKKQLLKKLSEMDPWLLASVLSRGLEIDAVPWPPACLSDILANIRSCRYTSAEEVRNDVDYFLATMGEISGVRINRGGAAQLVSAVAQHQQQGIVGGGGHSTTVFSPLAPPNFATDEKGEIDGNILMAGGTGSGATNTNNSTNNSAVKALQVPLLGSTDDSSDNILIAGVPSVALTRAPPIAALAGLSMREQDTTGGAFAGFAFSTAPYFEAVKAINTALKAALINRFTRSSAPHKPLHDALVAWRSVVLENNDSLSSSVASTPTAGGGGGGGSVISNPNAVRAPPPLTAFATIPIPPAALMASIAADAEAEAASSSSSSPSSSSTGLIASSASNSASSSNGGGGWVSRLLSVMNLTEAEARDRVYAARRSCSRPEVAWSRKPYAFTRKSMSEWCADLSNEPVGRKNGGRISEEAASKAKDNRRRPIVHMGGRDPAKFKESHLILEAATGGVGVEGGVVEGERNDDASGRTSPAMLDDGEGGDGSSSSAAASASGSSTPGKGGNPGGGTSGRFRNILETAFDEQKATLLGLRDIERSRATVAFDDAPRAIVGAFDLWAADYAAHILPHSIKAERKRHERARSNGYSSPSRHNTDFSDAMGFDDVNEGGDIGGNTISSSSSPGRRRGAASSSSNNNNHNSGKDDERRPHLTEEELALFDEFVRYGREYLGLPPRPAMGGGRFPVGMSGGWTEDGYPIMMGGALGNLASPLQTRGSPLPHLAMLRGGLPVGASGGGSWTSGALQNTMSPMSMMMTFQQMLTAMAAAKPSMAAAASSLTSSSYSGGGSGGGGSGGGSGSGSGSTGTALFPDTDTESVLRALGLAPFSMTSTTSSNAKSAAAEASANSDTADVSMVPTTTTMTTTTSTDSTETASLEVAIAADSDATLATTTTSLVKAEPSHTTSSAVSTDATSIIPNTTTIAHDDSSTTEEAAAIAAQRNKQMAFMVQMVMNQERKISSQEGMLGTLTSALERVSTQLSSLTTRLEEEKNDRKKEKEELVAIVSAAAANAVLTGASSSSSSSAAAAPIRASGSSSSSSTTTTSTTLTKKTQPGAPRGRVPEFDMEAEDAFAAAGSGLLTSALDVDVDRDVLRSILGRMSSRDRQGALTLAEMAPLDVDADLDNLADFLPPSSEEMMHLFDAISSHLRRAVLTHGELRSAWAASRRALLSIPAQVDVERRYRLRDGTAGDLPVFAEEELGLAPGSAADGVGGRDISSGSSSATSGGGGGGAAVGRPYPYNPSDEDAMTGGVVTLGDGRVALEFATANASLKAHIQRLEAQLSAQRIASIRTNAGTVQSTYNTRTDFEYPYADEISSNGINRSGGQSQQQEGDALNTTVEMQ